MFARPGSEGERIAAERARERIRERLEQLAAEEPPIEFRFTLSDQLQATLAAYFDAITDRVIEQALEVKAGEADARPEAPQLAPLEHQISLL